MNVEFIKYMAEMELGTPAPIDELDKVEKELQIIMPDEYRHFMEQHNGAEGAIGESNYLVIWPVEEIIELNEAYEVLEYTPSLVYFGSDGGDLAYAFDKRTVPLGIVKFPFDAIHIEEAERIANGFAAFIKTLHDE